MNPTASETQQLNGVVYQAHLCIYECVIQMDPTKLKKLDDFECIQSGHKFSPGGTDACSILLGNDWSEKRILVYGTNTSEAARTHINSLIKTIRQIGHDARLIGKLEISNIAVNGDLGESIRLEQLVQVLRDEEMDVQYEPEQFPALILKLGDPPTTFLLFSNGKFSVQGIKKRESIEPSIVQFKQVLQGVSNNISAK